MSLSSRKPAITFVIGYLLVFIAAFSSSVKATQVETIDQAAANKIAHAWSAFYNNEHQKTIKLTNQLANNKDQSASLHAMHLRARTQWLQGDPANQRQASKRWHELKQQAQNNRFAMARATIGHALMLAKRNQDQKAIQMLEKLVQLKLASCVRIEAQIELALLYANADRIEDAEKQLDDAEQALEYAESMGLNEPLKNAFLQGIEQARLTINNPGHALFARAQGLQREEKYPSAIQIYQQLLQEFPKSKFIDQSSFEIGSCLLALGREAQAIEQWQQFIASAPAGPWRGQAFIELIDLQLVNHLNLQEADRYAVQAKAAIHHALNNSKRDESWEQAVYPLGVRIGIVEWCSTRNKDAAETFKQAAAATADKSKKQRLDSLIEAASKNLNIIPDDCQLSQDNFNATSKPSREDIQAQQAAVALSLAIIHQVTGQYDLANRYYDRILGSPRNPENPATQNQPSRPAIPSLKGATPAQQSFATFGEGCIAQAKNQLDDANDAFVESIKLYHDGTWHDETLYRLAMLTEKEAEREFNQALRKANNNAKSDKLTPAERKVRQELLAQRIQSQAKALPYWQQLIERYPDSPRLEYALYRTGTILHNNANLIAETAAGTKGAERRGIVKQLNQQWEDSLRACKRLTDEFPTSELAGDAYLKQIDIALEQLFDAGMARQAASASINWVSNSRQQDQTDSRTALWATWNPTKFGADRTRLEYECYLRAAILEFLTANYDAAAGYLAKAKPVEAPAGGVIRDNEKNLHRMGLTYLRRAILQRQELVGEEALKAIGNDQNLEMMVRLADLYLFAIRPDKAEPIYLSIAQEQPPFQRVNRDVRAYAIAQLGLALNRQKRKQEAQEWFAKLQEKPFKGNHAAGSGLYRQAVTLFNKTQDARKTNELYRQMIRDYPRHPDTERAYMFLCINYLNLKERDKAEAAYAAMLRAFPDTKFRDYLRGYMNELITKHGLDQGASP